MTRAEAHRLVASLEDATVTCEAGGATSTRFASQE